MVRISFALTLYIIRPKKCASRFSCRIILPVRLKYVGLQQIFLVIKNSNYWITETLARRSSRKSESPPWSNRGQLTWSAGWVGGRPEEAAVRRRRHSELDSRSSSDQDRPARTGSCWTSSHWNHRKKVNRGTHHMTRWDASSWRPSSHQLMRASTAPIHSRKLWGSHDCRSDVSRAGQDRSVNVRLLISGLCSDQS